MDAKTAMLNHVESLIAPTKSKNNMQNNDSKIFRTALKQAIGVFRSPEDTANAMNQFDSLARHGEEMAAEVTLNSIGLQESKAGVCEYISQQLTKLSTTKPTVEQDAIKRVKQMLSRLKANIQKNGITIGGDDITEWARKEADIQIPKELQDDSWLYTSTASQTVNGKVCKEFGLHVVGAGRR